MEITKTVSCGLTRIRFGNVVHLAFQQQELVGFQSWKSFGCFLIELTFREGATIKTEYDDRAKWEKVISLIEDELAK